MIRWLLKISGIFMLRLVYGNKYSEKASDKMWLMLLLSSINIFWLMSIVFLFSGIAANDAFICAIMAVAYPIAIAIWTVLERKKQE